MIGHSAGWMYEWMDGWMDGTTASQVAKAGVGVDGDRKRVRVR